MGLALKTQTPSPSPSSIAAQSNTSQKRKPVTEAVVGSKKKQKLNGHRSAGLGNDSTFPAHAPITSSHKIEFNTANKKAKHPKTELEIVKKSHAKRPSVSASVASKSPPTEGFVEASKAPYLRYLDSYLSNRNSWKFNKTHQTNLLKNIFNIYRVPSSYNAAISEYLRGLQGAAAKDRLRETAEAILTPRKAKSTPTQEVTRADRITTMESAENSDAARRSAEDRVTEIVPKAMADAGHKSGQFIGDERSEEKRMRAERVLAALTVGNSAPHNVRTTFSVSRGNDFARSRGNFAETIVPKETLTQAQNDDDSSSSSESDISDSGGSSTISETSASTDADGHESESSSEDNTSDSGSDSGASRTV